MTSAADIGFITAIITAFINTILGFLVISNNPKSLKNILLFLFIIVFGVGAQAVSSLVILAGANLNLAGMIYPFGVIPYGTSFPIFYLFVREYLGIKGELYNLAAVAIVVLVSCVAAIVAPSLLFDIHYDPRVGYATLGLTAPLMQFALASGVYLFIVSIYHLIKRLCKETIPQERNRLWYLVIGSFFSFLGVIAICIPPIHILPWDMIGITITSFILTYAILKHHLLNITVIIRQSLIYSIISIATIMLFVLTGNILALFSAHAVTLMPAQLVIGAFIISFVVQYFYLNQQKVLSLLKQEQQQNKEIRDLLVVAAHELRTPLTIISNNLSLVLSGTGESKLSQQDNLGLKNADISTKRLITIVNNYLYMSYLDTGKIEANIQRINACEITQRMIGKAKGLLADPNKINIIFNCDNNQHFVMADPEKLQSILLNLIDNAIKFTSQGTVMIQHATEQNNLITRIVDTGIGIPADKQQFLFKSMKQLQENVMIRKTGGVGLGLYVSQKLAESMKGKLWLEESTEGKGSTFAFSLPLAPANT